MRQKAIKESKEFWEHKCVICLREPVDGAHIYPAGAFPALADSKYNIVPMCREHHTEFDNLNWKRKINWLQELTCKPAEMRKWLLALSMVKLSIFKGEKQ